MSEWNNFVSANAGKGWSMTQMSEMYRSQGAGAGSPRRSPKRSPRRSPKRSPKKGGCGEGRRYIRGAGCGYHQKGKY